MHKEDNKYSLVLSGGGARGFAHLGVLKALNEKGIFPEAISGTSAGALCAVMYSDGYSPDEILNFFKDGEILKYSDIVFPKTGLLKMTGLIKLIKKYLRASVFEDLNNKVFVATTNLNKGKVEYFSKGDLVKPIIASSSIPVLFSPVIINNNSYIDGGLMDNFPINPLRSFEKNIIIGAFVNHIDYVENFMGIKNIAMRSFQLSINKNVENKSKMCDIFIAPEKLNKYNIFDMNRRNEIFDIGYEEAIKILESTNH